MVKVSELTRLGRGRMFGRTPRRLGPRAKAVCIDARHAKAALNTAPNKTDANDADGLAFSPKPGSSERFASKALAAMRVRR